MKNKIEEKHLIDANDNPLTILRNHFDPENSGNVRFIQIENNRTSATFNDLKNVYYLHRHKFYNYANTDKILDPLGDGYVVFWCIVG